MNRHRIGQQKALTHQEINYKLKKYVENSLFDFFMCEEAINLLQNL